MGLFMKSRLNKFFAFVVGSFVALSSSSSALQAQSCGTFTMNQQPWDGYSTVGGGINHNFIGNFTLTDIKAGQQIIWQWSKNGTVIPGSDGDFTSNSNGGSFNQESTYNLIQTTANVDHSGDYRLVVQSSCVAATCTCIATFNSTAGIMRVDPLVNTQPAARSATLGNTATFSVTANDGLNGVALVYDWYRREIYSTPSEVYVGSTSGSTTSSFVVTLDQLSKTGNYFARVRHNRGGANLNREVYGQTLSTDAPLALTIPNASALTTNVCRPANWAISNALRISPENPVGGTYRVDANGSFFLYLNSDSSRYNGLGNCFPNFAPVNSYICYDSSRSSLEQEYFIQAPSSLINTTYRYEKNSVAIAGTTQTALRPDEIQGYHNNAANLGDDGFYSLRLDAVPCAVNPGVSNTLNVDVLTAEITISSQEGYVISPQGSPSSVIQLPSSFSTVDRGGASIYVVAYHPTPGLNHQWQKYNSNSASWLNLPADATGNFYLGEQSTNLLFYYDDYSGPTTRGIRYADAGAYRCKITTADNLTTTYSQTFNLNVLPQAPFSANIADSLSVKAGDRIPIYGTVYPL